MKIAIASLGDPRSVKTWSGIPSHIVPALEERGHELVGITITKPAEPWYFNWLRRFYVATQKKWFMASVEKPVLQAIGRQIDAEVARIKPNVVLVIHADFLAYTTFKQPAITIHDATFANLVGYYSSFSNLTNRSVQAGNQMYSLAMQRASAAVFSADWASQSAINDYNTPASKVFTVPLGANLHASPDAALVKQWIVDRSQSETCNLLYLGGDWKRKGGPDLLRIVAHLNQTGIQTVLHVVGATPDIPAQYQTYVNVVGYLRKNDPVEAQRLQAYFRTSSALIVPSSAECYGCVFCEANAYGLPALARNTGGIPEIINEGVNGLMLNAAETPEDFAERWSKVWLDKQAYHQMSLNALHAYQTRLNYAVFAERLEQIISKVI